MWLLHEKYGREGFFDVVSKKPVGAKASDQE
jgi:hypothetical protein